MPAFTASRTAFLFNIGNAPGIPVQIGHILVFGSPPNVFSHEQNTFVFVSSSECISSPITVSYFILFSVCQIRTAGFDSSPYDVVLFVFTYFELQHTANQALNICKQVHFICVPFQHLTNTVDGKMRTFFCTRQLKEAVISPKSMCEVFAYK